MVEPIASPGAMDSLKSVVPDNPAGDGRLASTATLLPSRAHGYRRVLRACLTGGPLLAADVVFAFAVLTLSTTVVSGWNTTALVQQAQAAAAFCGLYAIIGALMGLYPGTGTNVVAILRTQVLSVFYAAGFVLSASVTAAVTLNHWPMFLCGIGCCAFFLPFVRSTARRICERFEWWGERVIIAGTGKHALSIYEYLTSNLHLGLRPIGVVDDDPNNYWVADSANEIRFLGVTDQLVTVCRRLDCHWVIMTTGGRSREDLERYLSVCSLVPNLIVVPDELAIPSLWCTSFDAAGLAGFRLKDRLLSPLVRVVKRLTDIALSSLLLILASPLMIAIAAAVALTSRGPILYGDNRLGRDGRTFRALKFRTMVCNAEAVLQDYLRSNEAARLSWERNQKLRRDPRIIPGIGNALRRWSLDELPQLWNVLRGDMSLVGPRPMFPAETAKYGSVHGLYARVRPGLTGLWQVSGRNDTSYDARIQLVTYYVRNWSLWLDYYILLRTIKTVITRRGSC